MIASAPAPTTLNPWWPTSPPPAPRPQLIADYTPAIRRDLIRTVQWCLTATPSEITACRDQPGLTRGERLAVAICLLVHKCPPAMPAADWLAVLRRWDAAMGDCTCTEHPPMPWGDETASRIYASQATGEAAAVTCPLGVGEVR
jgi:hypothetical protein